jgi:hypothetical protein
MDRHKKQQIKLELHEWHKALFYEFKNATLLEEVDVWYVAIQCRYSFWVVDEIRLQKVGELA